VARKRPYSIEFHFTVHTPNKVDRFDWSSDAFIPDFRAMLDERYDSAWTYASYTFSRRCDWKTSEGHVYNHK
jgi:hypothetical protein